MDDIDPVIRHECKFESVIAILISVIFVFLGSFYLVSWLSTWACKMNRQYTPPHMLKIQERMREQQEFKALLESAKLRVESLYRLHRERFAKHD